MTIRAFSLVKQKITGLNDGNVLLCGDIVATDGLIHIYFGTATEWNGDGTYRIHMDDGWGKIAYGEDGTRFAIAHEFGHIFLGHFELTQAERDSRKDEIEEQADAYALALVGEESMRKTYDNSTNGSTDKESLRIARRRVKNAAKWTPYVIAKTGIRAKTD